MKLKQGGSKMKQGKWILEEITNEKNRYAIDDDG